MVKKALILVTKAEIGGAQQSVSYLAQELHKNGLDVTLAYGEGNFLQEKNADVGIKLHKFENLRRTWNPLTNISLIFEIKKYLEENRTDTLHLNSSNTLFCAIGGKMAKNKPKIIFTFRGMSLLDKNYTKSYFKNKLIIFIYKILLKFVDTQVFVSQENFEHGKKIGLAKNAFVIYNGLPALNFLPREEVKEILQKKYNLNLNNKFIIGSIGRLAYQKNYEFFIKQMPQILQTNEDIILLIIGTGPEKEKCENLIKKLNLQNKIFILEGINDAYQIMNAFDLFVLTSRFEGMSITILEALQAGLPILASDVGGNEETLSNAGILYPLDDSQDFINKIKKLIAEKNYRDELSEKAKNKSEEFSIKNTAKKYLEIY